MKKVYEEPSFDVVTILLEDLMAGVGNSTPENYSVDGSELEL